MSKFFPMPKKEGSKFDPNRGYTSLDGKGRPVWDISRHGATTTFRHNKTGKLQYDISVPKEKIEIEEEGCTK